jgi:hypothetical protein
MQSISTIDDEQTSNSESKYARFFHFATTVFPTFCPGKEKKRVNKSLAQSREALAAASEVSEAELREALKQIKSEPLPTSEQYFMSQVAMGEQLSSAGAFRTFCVHVRHLTGLQASISPLLCPSTAHFAYIHHHPTSLTSTKRRFPRLPSRFVLTSCFSIVNLNFFQDCFGPGESGREFILRTGSRYR